MDTILYEGVSQIEREDENPRREDPLMIISTNGPRPAAYRVDLARTMNSQPVAPVLGTACVPQNIACYTETWTVMISIRLITVRMSKRNYAVLGL